MHTALLQLLFIIKTHKRKPTICKAEISNPSLRIAFIIFPASPETIWKIQHSILKKSEFTTKRYYANILLILKLKKQCLYNAVRGSRDQSWVHTLYVLYEVMCWWFQITKFHAAVEKHFYSKKVISEAFAFLRSTAKHPVAARPRFIFFNENPLAILMLYQSSIQSTSCLLLFPGPTLSQKQCRKITNVANKLAQEFMPSMEKNTSVQNNLLLRSFIAPKYAIADDTACLFSPECILKDWMIL